LTTRPNGPPRKSVPGPGAAPAAPRAREFDFDHEDFIALRALVKELTGINLADSKEELVYGRVSRRLRTLKLSNFGDYRELLRSDDQTELTEFCNAMTTNLTAFFRESHHFDYLREHLLLPRSKDAQGSRRLRIWSAACSTGEEPYSIAMTVCESIPDWRRWDIKILATDVDSQVLQRAERGVYTEDRFKGMEPGRLQRFFSEQQGTDARLYAVSPDLAKLITFKQLNLMHDLPMTGPFDAIVCRNVIIYFDKDTQRQLFERVAKLQRPADLLFLGHSESLFKISNDYSLIGKTIYRRI
jgi:chemotaxis protein methyltransferase CheR